jgi:hypothetical protein
LNLIRRVRQLPPDDIVMALDRQNVAWLVAPPVRTLWTW